MPEIFKIDDRGTINPRLLDRLSDEEFKVVMDDPEAFMDLDAEMERESGKQNDGNPSPGDGRTRTASGDDAGTDTTHDFATDADVEARAAELGVPASWLLDKEGVPYENGQILGKYATKELAFEAVPHMMGLIGKRETIAQPEQVPEYNGEEVVAYVPELQKTVREWAHTSAAERMKRDFAEADLPVPTSYDEVRAFLDNGPPQMAAKLSILVDQEEVRGITHINEHAYYEQHAEDINTHAVEQGFEQVAGLFLDATGLTAEEWEDQEELRSLYDATIKSVTDLPEGDPRRAAFYEGKAGVQVLSPEKIARYCEKAFRPQLNEAIRNVTAQELEMRYKNANERPTQRRWPHSIAADQGEGASGAETGLMPWEELRQSDSLDKFIKHFGGENNPEAVNLATREWTRQYEYHAKQAAESGGTRVPMRGTF